MVQAYTIGTPHDKPDLSNAERNLSKLLKEFRSATISWSKPTIRIYKVQYNKQPNGLITSFSGKVVGLYWCEWDEVAGIKNKFYYKTGGKTYSVSKEGKLTEIRRK